MAKAKNGVNRSEEVRKLLKANPRITSKEVISTLAGKGIEVSAHLYYFVKGQMRGRRKKAQKMVAKVAATTGTPSADAVTTIRKVKAFAGEVGGLKHLKALVDALSE
jgi:hypothetical protein